MTESIPHTLLDDLEHLAANLRRAMEQYELLDRSGKVPRPVPHRRLMRHITASQHLAQITGQLAAEALERGSGTAREVSLLLTAAAHVSTASSRFAETARIALAPHRVSNPEGQMALSHTDARAGLRRAAEDVTSAVTGIRKHQDLQRFIASRYAPSPPQQPSPPGSVPQPAQSSSPPGRHPRL